MPRLVTVLVSGLGCVDSGAEVMPNFVVILTDNLGYGDIGPFGSALNNTRHLDCMATEGMTLIFFTPLSQFALLREPHS